MNSLIFLCCLSYVVVSSSAPYSKQHYLSLRAPASPAAPGTLAAPLLPAPLPPLQRTDTELLLGAEYTPSGASNELWLAFYPLYRAQVQRDLANVRRRLAATTLRVFLHSLLWEADSAGLLANLEDLLALAAAEGIRLGLVLFDSCWNASGASLAAPCQPTPGVHNSCWMQSPQAPDRTNVSRYEPYVSGVVGHFARDERVAWVEIYNEPHVQDPFVLALRAAGYAWAKALAPAVPILSCWDYDTPGISDVSDIHAYSTDFPGWTASAYATPARGALFTEAGCRSFQAPYSGDAGSPLLVLHYLQVLRARRDAGLLPYVPGAMLAWEVAVGNSNTRWHWGSPAGAPEPSIPWCGLLFPDGTPVSHTEAAALRAYATAGAVDDLLLYTHFLPPPSASPPELPQGAPFLQLQPGQAWWAPQPSAAGGALPEEVLVEASVWPGLSAASGAPTGVIELVLRAANASIAGGCSSTVLPNTNACPGAAGESNFPVPPSAPDPAGLCAAACCAAAANASSSGSGGCSAWVLLPGMSFDDKACACASAPCTCCWLKPPSCSGTGVLAGCTTGLLPPPPPLSGYVVALNYSAQPPLLTLARRSSSNSTAQLLGAFDLSTLDNGVVDGWNLLRVVLRSSGAIEVYFNVALRDTGFVGNASDATRLAHAPAPRIAVLDPQPLPAGGSGLAIAAGGAPARVEYVGVLPASVL